MFETKHLPIDFKKVVAADLGSFFFWETNGNFSENSGNFIIIFHAIWKKVDD